MPLSEVPATAIPAPGMPVLRRTADRAGEGPAAIPDHPRGPLARTADGPADAPAAPDRPLLQRTRDRSAAAGRSEAPAAGLGAPMRQLPPTARLLTDRPGGSPAPAPAPAAPGMPMTQRRVDAGQDGASSRLGGRPAVTPTSAPPGERSPVARKTATSGGGTPVPEGAAPSPAASPAPSPPRRPVGRVAVTGAVPLVIARRIAGLADRSGPPGPHALGSPRSLRLLSDRSLTTGLGTTGPGIPTASAARPAASRPVVPARWAHGPGATGPSGSFGPPGSPAVQRAALAPVLPGRTPAPAPSAPLPEARRPVGPLPVAGPQGPVVVQPAPAGSGPAPLPPLRGVVRPGPQAAAPVAPSAPVAKRRGAAATRGAAAVLRVATAARAPGPGERGS
ncbi:hypothetical protein ACFU8I_41505, partial [Streptomyces sp. NPDC057540]